MIILRDFCLPADGRSSLFDIFRRELPSGPIDSSVRSCGYGCFPVVGRRHPFFSAGPSGRSGFSPGSAAVRSFRRGCHLGREKAGVSSGEAGTEGMSCGGASDFSLSVGGVLEILRERRAISSLQLRRLGAGDLVDEFSCREFFLADLASLKLAF